MTKKKKDIGPEKVVRNKDRFAQAKEARRQAHEAKVSAETTENSRDEFRKYFVKIRKKLELAQDMEGVLWIHLKRRGFNKKEKFAEGIKDFGYKL